MSAFSKLVLHGRMSHLPYLCNSIVRSTNRLHLRKKIGSDTSSAKFNMYSTKAIFTCAYLSACPFVRDFQLLRGRFPV